MDILDILVAKALTPQGQIDTYAARARKAITDANTAVNTIESAADNISTLTEQTESINTTALASAQAATQALEDVNAALAQIDEATISTIDDEIDKMRHALVQRTTDNYISYDLTTTYPSGLITSLQNLIKYYNAPGQNTDGTMTQKAITDALNALDQKINTSGGATIAFDPENAGHLTIVKSDGSLGVSTINEDELVNALNKINEENPDTTGIVGLNIDYQNYNFERIYDAVELNMGADFDKYSMYGGRRRCNVNNNGEITAWFGDNNYVEDGSNGDVMVYLPKFYYKRTPILIEDNVVGKIVRKEAIAISSTPQSGFKIHPAFVDINGNTLEYILLGAYESCYYDTSTSQLIKNDSGTIDFSTDILRSCANAKPVSGVNNALTIENAERMAKNHGTGWHITNAAIESANQILMLIEFGAMNGQTALEAGLTDLPNTSGYNCASQTGSTASLGNITGTATSTINITNGQTNTYSIAGRRAITYRGMENPWGNMWRFIGGLNISGNGTQRGGIPYVCSDFNYTPTQISSNYTSAGFCLPNNNGWISAMGYGNESLDWLLMPAETTGANSLFPVGDNIWITSNLNTVHVVLVSGMWQQTDNDGMFYYACDNDANIHMRAMSARIMHIPTYNSSVYINNINSWTNQMQG